MLMRSMIALVLPVLSLVAAGCTSTDVRSGLLGEVEAVGDDVQVTLEECPAAVQATILDHADGAPIVEIERTTEHGETLFEVDAQGREGIFEFDVAEDGTFRGIEADDDDDGDDDDDADDDDDDDDGDDDEDEDGDVQVTLAECPAAVQATIAQQVGRGSINEIERSPAGNYEVDANGPNGQFEFVVAGDGTYLGPEGDDDGDDDDDDGDDDDDDDDGDDDADDA